MFVYGIYPDEESAANGLGALVNAGFPVAAISGLMHEGQEVEELAVEGRTGVTRGAVVGAALGALGGAILMPAAGFLAAGPLLAALEGAVIGGAAGMGFGGITGLGFWREDLDLIHRHITQGDVIIGVEATRGRKASAEQALRTAGPKDVRTSRSMRTARREIKEEHD